MLPAALKSSFSKRPAPAVFGIATSRRPPGSSRSRAIANHASASSFDLPGRTITSGNFASARSSTRANPAFSHAAARGLNGCQPTTSGHAFSAGCGSAPRNKARLGTEIPSSAEKASINVSSAGFMRHS